MNRRGSWKVLNRSGLRSSCSPVARFDDCRKSEEDRMDENFVGTDRQRRGWLVFREKTMAAIDNPIKTESVAVKTLGEYLLPDDDNAVRDGFNTKPRLSSVIRTNRLQAIR